MEQQQTVIQKPWCGWSKVTFPGLPPFTASYLTLVHIDLMYFINDYFETFEGEMTIDSEGDVWNIYFADGEIDVQQNDVLTYSLAVDEPYMRELARNTYKDIVSNLYAWLVWDKEPDEIEDEDVDVLCDCLTKTYSNGYPNSNDIPNIKAMIEEAIASNS